MIFGTGGWVKSWMVFEFVGTFADTKCIYYERQLLLQTFNGLSPRYTRFGMEINLLPPEVEQNLPNLYLDGELW